jgi:CMP-N-acetylneuraminic acid synthetase
MSRVVAIVPVRSGSKRVVGKNTRPFAGSSLLEIKIRQLLGVSGLAEVCVNSDDPAMLEIAARAGAKTQLRDPAFATDTVPMSDVYAHMASKVECDEILLTHVTNPLAGSDVYDACLTAYSCRGSEYDSLTTVADVKDFLYLDGKPLNYDPARKPRSQDLPDIVKLTHVASVLPREMVIEKKDIVGYKPLFFKLGGVESVDIDTPLDFEIAEWLYSKNLSRNIGA